MVDGDLYRRGTDGVFLQFISREEGGELLADIHESESGNHSSSRTLVGKAFRQGFYWPTALQDQPNWLGAAGRASSTQSRYTNQHRHSTPFLCHGRSRSGGLDILGPFPKAIGGFEWLYVAINKFTKWPEANYSREGQQELGAQIHQGSGGTVWCSKSDHH